MNVLYVHFPYLSPETAKSPCEPEAPHPDQHPARDAGEEAVDRRHAGVKIPGHGPFVHFRKGRTREFHRHHEGEVYRSLAPATNRSVLCVWVFIELLI